MGIFFPKGIQSPPSPPHSLLRKEKKIKKNNQNKEEHPINKEGGGYLFYQVWAIWIVFSKFPNYLPCFMSDTSMAACLRHDKMQIWQHFLSVRVFWGIFETANSMVKKLFSVHKICCVNTQSSSKLYDFTDLLGVANSEICWYDIIIKSITLCC